MSAAPEGLMVKHVSMLLLFGFIASPALSQVYKCTEGGRVVFSDYPCQRTDAKMIDVRPAAGGPVNRSSEYWEEQRRKEQLEAERREAEMKKEVERRIALKPAPTLSSAEEAQLIERAKKAVLYKMIDADSSRFRNLSATGGEVCGEVNGKNKFGGYAGFQIFWVKFDPDPDVWMGEILGPSAERVCAKRIAVTAKKQQ